MAKDNVIKENTIEKPDGQQASKQDLVQDQPALEKMEPEKPVEVEKDVIQKAEQAEPVVQPTPVDTVADKIETPVIDQQLIEVEHPDKKAGEQADPDPAPIAVASQVESEVVQQVDIEGSLDVFDEVASGDGDATDPVSKPEPAVEKIVPSGDADAGDPVKPAPDNVDKVAAGDSEAGEPMKPAPDEADLIAPGDPEGAGPSKDVSGSADPQDSGDGDVSDPSKKGDGNVTDPVKPVSKDEVLVSGDSEAGEPTKSVPGKDDLISSGDPDAGDPVKPAPDQAQAGDSDPAPPSSLDPAIANVSPVVDVAVNVEPVDELLAVDLEDDEEEPADQEDEDSAGEDDDTSENAPVVATVESPLDASVAAEVELDLIDIDADRFAGIQDSLIATIGESGQIDQAALDQLFDSAQIQPDQNSLVSSGTVQPVDIIEHEDGSYSVTHHEVEKSIVKVYDAEGNLTTQQVDDANGTMIIEYGQGFTTITIISENGQVIEAVHNDGGGGTVNVTDPDGTTNSATVGSSSGSGDGSNNDSQDSGSDSQDSSDSDSGSNDDDDDDDDDDKNDDGDQEEAEQADTDSNEDSEDGESSKEQEGTPNPANDDSDAPPLFFATDGKMGQQEQSTVERGIDVAVGGGHTDPADHKDAGATLEFLTSELGQEQLKATEEAIEQAQNGGHTDPADDDFDKIEVITAADLEHIEFIVGGGGAAGPAEGSGNGGQPVDGGVLGGGGGPVAEDDDDPDDDDDLGAGASMFVPVVPSAVHQDIDSIVDAAASFMDVFDLQFNVDTDDLEDDF